MKQTNNDSSKDFSDTEEDELEKLNYEVDSVEYDRAIEKSNIFNSEGEIIDIKSENN